MRYGHHNQRKAGGVRLCPEHLSPDCMHGDAVRRLVDRRQQTRGLSEPFAAKHMKHPCAVFAAAPRNKNFHTLMCVELLPSLWMQRASNELDRLRDPGSGNDGALVGE